MNMFFIPSS